jgi:hypothetical protein
VVLVDPELTLFGAEEPDHRRCGHRGRSGGAISDSEIGTHVAAPRRADAGTLVGPIPIGT